MTTTRTTTARIASAVTATVVAALAGVALAAPSQAATGHLNPPSKADKAAAKIAGRTCFNVTDDVTWEACNLGEFQAIRDRALLDTDYESDANALVIDYASRRYAGKQAAKPSKADKRAIATANAECHYLVAEFPHANLYEACEIGAFTMERGRAITPHDYRVTATGSHRGALVLTRASRAIAK